MIKRKALTGYVIAAIALFSATQIDFNFNNSTTALASEGTTLHTLKNIEKTFIEKRENIDFASYIETLKECLAEASLSESDEEITKATDLLTLAVINSIDNNEARSLIKEYEAIIAKITNVDTQVRVYSNLIRLNRMLGNVKGADKALELAKKLEKQLTNKAILGICYLYEAHGDVVDLTMKEQTLDNLNKAINLLKDSEDSFFTERLILAYIEQSQVLLYSKKDASSAVSILETAQKLATKTKNEYYSLIVEELITHTYPFFLRYEEGIYELKPVVEKYSKKGYYAEAFKAQDKLVTLAFDSGDNKTALKEGAKLSEMLKKVVNKPRKEYFKEYNGALYQANVYAVEGTLDKAIKLLESKELDKFKHVYTIDQSVYNMYQGNVNFYSGNTEKALTHYEAMMKAIEENSIGDSAYVYTDTSTTLASAYYEVGRYQEGFDVLARHINAYVAHDMEVNKRDTAKLKEQYNAAQKDKELLSLKLETERKESNTKILGAMALGLTGVIAVLFIEGRKVKKYNKLLSSLSTTDGLTGLSNRRALDEFLGQQSNIMLQVSKANEEEKEVYISAIMMDIDFFKKYNDNYGHTKGDKVLQTVGETLKPFCTSESDIIARYGGEEFALILTNTDKNEALQLASKIKKAILAAGITHEFSEIESVVTASIGVATKNITTDSIDTLLEDADKALYYSKSHGRNTFTHFSDMK